MLVETFLIHMTPDGFAEWLRYYVEKTKGERYAHVGPPGHHLGKAGRVNLILGSGDSRIDMWFWIKRVGATRSRLEATCETPETGRDCLAEIVALLKGREALDGIDQKIVEITEQNPKITDTDLGLQVDRCRQRTNVRRNRLGKKGYKVRP